MNTSDIVDLKDELVERDGPRHRKYDLNMAAIGGAYDSRRMDGFWDIWQAITDRPIPTDREEYEFRINFIPNIIKTVRSFVAVVPSLKCPPSSPPTPENQEPKKKAEKLERVYSGFWESSFIGKRMNQIGYWNPALGTSVGVIWPDMKAKRPTFQVRSPYGCYPVLADVDGYDMKQVIFHTKYKPRQAAAMFPQFKTELMAMNEDVEIIEYLDGERLTRVVADKYRTKDIENKWEFVSCFLIPNESFGEGPWGDDSIAQVIPVQDEYKYRESLKTSILEQTILQPLHIEGGENLPEEIPMGPRDAICTVLGGKVSRVAPVQVPYQYLQSQSDLIKLIDRVSNIPQVLQGQFDGNVLTGKGVQGLMGGTQMAFNVMGNEIYPAIARGNEMAMKMWHALWPRKTHTVYSMGKESGLTVESFKTGEFEGWYKNIVYVDSSTYFDSNQLFISVLQAVQNRLMSRQTAMQYVPGVTDPIAEQALIDAEFKQDMALQQAAAAFDQANVQPSMGAQGYTNSMLEQGYAGKTPPPEAVGGFEAPGGEEVPPEQGNLLQDMIEFFQSIPLRGKVWLAGAIVSDPAYSPQSPQWHGVDVFLEDPNDKSAISTTVRTQFPEIGKPFNYHTGEPSEPAMLVYDPGGEEIPEDFGAPEEAMGMPPEAMEPTGLEAMV